MSNKSILFDAINTFPPTVTDTAFPTLTVPTAPEDVEDAILCNANCQRAIVTWLNSFAGIKVKELYGMVGMLSPSSQAIVAGLLQSDGTSVTSGTVEDIVKVIGDETSGGAFTGAIESIVRREATMASLDTVATLTAGIPSLVDHTSVLSSIMSVALTFLGVPGLLGLGMGELMTNLLIGISGEIIKRTVLNSEAPEAEESLKRIADALKLEESETEGDVLGKLQSMLEKIDVYLSEWSEEEQNYLGIAYYVKKLKETLEQMVDEEWVADLDGHIIAWREKTVDETE